MSRTGQAVIRLGYDVGNPAIRSVELSRGMLDRMVRDAKFINAFPGFKRFVRTVVYTKKGGCGCRRNAVKRSVKRHVVNHNALKRHIISLSPARQTQLKQLLGVRALKITVRRADNKISVARV